MNLSARTSKSFQILCQYSKTMMINMSMKRPISQDICLILNRHLLLRLKGKLSPSTGIPDVTAKLRRAAIVSALSDKPTSPSESLSESIPPITESKINPGNLQKRLSLPNVERCNAMKQELIAMEKDSVKLSSGHFNDKLEMNFSPLVDCQDYSVCKYIKF